MYLTRIADSQWLRAVFLKILNWHYYSKCRQVLSGFFYSSLEVQKIYTLLSFMYYMKTWPIFIRFFLKWLCYVNIMMRKKDPIINFFCVVLFMIVYFKIFFKWILKVENVGIKLEMEVIRFQKTGSR
jgi:hypothetical protein